MSNYVNLNDQPQTDCSHNVQTDQRPLDQTTPVDHDQARVCLTTDHRYVQTQMLSGMLPGVPTGQQRPAYKHKPALRLGIVQIVNGILAVQCGITTLVLKTFLYFTGVGIGAGAVYMAAGVFGVISARQRATWAILTCMVLSIVAAVASGVTIIASAEGIDLNYRGHPFYEINVPDVKRAGMAVDAVLIVASVVEIVVAIAQATLCCRVTCCATGQSQPEIMVVYMPQQMPSATQQQQLQQDGGGQYTAPLPASVVMYPNTGANYTIPAPAADV